MKLFWHLLLVEILQVSAFLFALEREKRTTYPKYNGFRDEIRNSISIALGKRPADFNAFLLELQSQGYQINSFEAPGVEASRHIGLKLLGVDSGMPYYIDILLFYKRIDCGILYI